MKRLENKVAIISGAAGGIGKVSVEVFLQEGASILAVDLVEEKASTLFPNISDSRLVYFRADLSREDDVIAVARRCIEEFGRVDVLFNNHGVMIGKPFLETTSEDFDYVINGNLKSVFMLSKETAQEMVKSGGGSIIINSSVGGLIGFFNMSAYGASKAGCAHLARLLATDLAGYNIRVNAICPGIIDTPQPWQFLKDVEDKQDVWKSFADMALLKRVGQPEEVTRLALFLASDESSFMTGAVIPVDGGMTAV